MAMQTDARLATTEDLGNSREAVASGILRLLLWTGPAAVVLSATWSYRLGDWIEFVTVALLYATVVAALAWRGRTLWFRANLLMCLGYIGGALQLGWGAPQGHGYQVLLVTAVLGGLLLEPRAARLWCAGIIATVFFITGAYGLGLIRTADSAAFDVTRWLAQSSSFAVLALVAFVPQEYIVRRLTGSLEDSRRDREELDRIFSLSLDMLCIASMDGRFIRTNPAWSRTLGYGPEELEGRLFVDFVHPDDVESTLQAIAQLSAGKEITDYTNQYRCRDGSYRWIEWRSTPYEGNRIYAAARDITRRQQAEAALRESEASLRSIFLAAPIGIGMVANRVITRANDRLCEMTGYSRDELCGQSARMLYPSDDDFEYVGQEKYRQITERGTGTVETRWKCKNGKVIDILLSSTPLDAGNWSAGVTFTSLDITDRHRLVEQLRDVNADLEKRVAERTAVAEDRATQLRILASRLTSAENLERKRVAQILHEHFQQLLVSVNFNIGVLRRNLEDKDLLKILDRMSETIGETVQVSRTLTVELCPPVLYDMGLAAGLEWLGRWMEDRYDLHVDVSADPEANPQAEDLTVLLFHSTRELLFNIAKHAQVKRASVRMARRNRDHVEILVADQGVGFDPSSPLAGSERATGFGLFSIRERVGLAGGHVQIDSSPDRGTRVTLLAPLGQAKPPGEDQTRIIASP